MSHERDRASSDETQDAAVPPFGGRAPGTDSIKEALADLRDEAGSQIGPYKLLAKIGEGGFGVVYLAEQIEPVRRRVALKVIKPGMDSRQIITRFGQERQALAVMDHPNIARVLDAGTTDRGLPYFVMEFIKGESITAYCDRHNLTIRNRLSVFIFACDAVQHAHMKGIIHRDIKPSNILVAAGDHGPIVKVIDFGVAKALAHTAAQATIFTEQGQLIGTPEYMSPEQAEMGATDIDTRTDVYSLGVVLYELLTGVTPFDSKTLRAAGFGAIQRMIREVEPPKPSTRLSSLGQGVDEIVRHRQMELGALSRELSRELDWIPVKALRKDRTERYDSPADLANDVRSFLEGRPLKAGPESSVYRLRKYVRRNRAALAAGATFAVLLIGGIAGTSTFALRSAAAARREADQRQIAEANERRVLSLEQTLAALERRQRLFSAEALSKHEGRSPRPDHEPE